MDALSDVLRTTHLSGGVFLQAEFTAPWCMVAHVTSKLCAPFLGPTVQLIPYHYVVEGELWVSVEGSGPPEASGRYCSSMAAATPSGKPASRAYSPPM